MKKDSRNTGQDGAESKSPGNESESFGAWLSRQRTGRGIKLEDIAESSKISLQYLKAFEADRFDMLPADVFAKGFLRQYASFVGLDPEEVINFYLTASQEEDDDETPEPRPKGRSGGSTGRLIAISVVLIASLVALVWWLSQRADVFNQSAESPQTGTAVTASRTPDAPAAPSSDAVAPSTAPATTTPETAAPPTSTAAEPPSPGGDTDPQSNAPAATDANPAVTEPAPPSTSDSGALRVVAEFSDSCWVEARVDGERRVSMTKVQGESLILRAEDEIDFIFGNVEAVRLEVNGNTFPLTPRRGTPRLAVHIDRSVLASSTPATTSTPETGGTTP